MKRLLIRSYLWCLGKPVHNIDYVWGDNESIINSLTVPDAKLHKRHNILSFHFIRSMIAQEYINMLHIKTKYNFTDILSKHWGYQGKCIELIQPVFHHEGNTVALFLDNTLEVNVSIDDEDKTRFGILGSDRTLPQPHESMMVVR